MEIQAQIFIVLRANKHNTFLNVGVKVVDFLLSVLILNRRE